MWSETLVYVFHQSVERHTPIWFKKGRFVFGNSYVPQLDEGMPEVSWEKQCDFVGMNWSNSLQMESKSFQLFIGLAKLVICWHKKWKLGKRMKILA